MQAIGDEDARTNRLVELNVIEQVTNLAKTSVIQKAWKDRQGPHLHGWVYGLDNGLIKPIFELPAGSRIDPLYEYDDL
jgi:carbonic anhydrase